MKYINQSPNNRLREPINQPVNSNKRLRLNRERRIKTNGVVNLRIGNQQSRTCIGRSLFHAARAIFQDSWSLGWLHSSRRNTEASSHYKWSWKRSLQKEHENLTEMRCSPSIVSYIDHSSRELNSMYEPHNDELLLPSNLEIYWVTSNCATIWDINPVFWCWNMFAPSDMLDISKESHFKKTYHIPRFHKTQQSIT